MPSFNKSLLTLGALVALQAQAAVFINELHYDNDGADTSEFVEIAGSAGTNLDGWAIELYNGSNGTKYGSKNLNGTLSDAGDGFGYFVVDHSGIQNGSPDGVALVNNGTLVQFLSYEGTFTAVDGAASGEESTDIGVSEPSSTPAGYSLQLSGSGKNYDDFTWQSPVVATKGSKNTGQTFTGGTTPTGKTLSISPTDANKAEGNSGSTSFSFKVTRGDTSEDASVNYLVSAISGTNSADDNDFGGTYPSGTINFTGAITEETITVNVLGDKDVEADETFKVTLSNPTSGWTILSGKKSAEGTIQNDDASTTTAITKIHTIQGTADSNAMDGQKVTIEGIVIGDFQYGDTDVKRDLGGFFVQEEDADADTDTMTSEGIFVYEGGLKMDVNVGDKVKVTGIVGEFYNMTQLKVSQSSDIVIDIVAGTQVLPTPATVKLPAQNVIQKTDKYSNHYYIPDLEAYEGMLVTFSNLTITEMYQLGKFGEIKLSQGGRLKQFTQHSTPNAAGYDAHLVDAGKRTIVYEDGLNGENNRIDFDGLDNFNTASSIRMGDTIDSLTGVLTYGYNQYRVRSTKDGTVQFNSVNVRDAMPKDVGGTLKLASFNVLNYFTTLDGGNTKNTCGPSKNIGCRGADTQVEFDRQRAKIFTALFKMDADIVGLMELENTDEKGIKDLVTGLNQKIKVETGTDGTYTYVTERTIGDDAIRVAMIYKTNTVEKMGDYKILDSTVDANFIDTKNRPVLAQTFKEKATGGLITAAVVHFKSKGSPCDSLGDPNNNDGAGNCNLTRTKAAQALNDWLATDPTKQGSNNILLLGDFNAYAKETPVTTLESAGYTNLMSVNTLVKKAFNRHSKNIMASRRYVFNGQVGTMDYAFANANLLVNVTGVTEWHINGDEPSALDYNIWVDGSKPEHQQIIDLFDSSVPWRSSDHDPIIVGLALSPQTHEVTVSAINGSLNVQNGVDLTAVADNAKVSFDIVPDIGYEVDRVSGCGGSLNGTAFLTDAITADCSITATFKKTLHSVTLSADNGTLTAKNANLDLTQVPYGTVIKFDIAPATGYKIDSVKGCGGLLSGSVLTTESIRADCEIIATFTKTLHVVTVSASNGTITAQDTNLNLNHIPYGMVVKFDVAPATGYGIGSISGCGGSLNGSVFTTGAIMGNCSVTSAFDRVVLMKLNLPSAIAAEIGKPITPVKPTLTGEQGDVVYSVENLPAGLNVDSSTGEISGILSSTVGTTVMTIIATDAHGYVVRKEITLVAYEKGSIFKDSFE